MAGKTYNSTIKFIGQFDSSGITKGLQDIKKQVTNANISEELKKQFEDAFKKVEVNLPVLERLTNKEEFNLKDIQALQKLIKELTKDWENLTKVTDQIDLSKTFSKENTAKIANIDKQIKETQKSIQDARKELIEGFTKGNTISVNSKNISDALTDLFTVKPNEIDSKFNEIKQQFTNGIEQTQQEIKNKLDSSKIHKTGDTLIEHFFGKDSGVSFADKQTTRIVKEVDAIIRKYREFKAIDNQAGVAEQIQKLNKVLTDTANFKFPEGYNLFGLPTKEDLDTLNQIGGILDKLKEAAKGKEVFFTDKELELVDQMKQKVQAETQAAVDAENANKNLGESVKKESKNFLDAGAKVEELAEAERKAAAQADALKATFGSLAKRIINSISALTVFNKSIQIVHKAIDSVKELDAAFTQIAIVSGQSNEAAWKMFDSFNKLAKQYSITTKDLTEGAKLFYQQGLSAADTMKMVEASTISAALGEVTMTEAANTLTAAIQGYNESAEVAMAYTDKIAMVGAVSAADFNELSAAMEKTASSAYTAGIDFDHLLGYLGKMIEVTREAPRNYYKNIIFSENF